MVIKEAVRFEMGNELTGFRRSERVSIEMPVEVYALRENEKPTSEVCKTVSVNAHGALLALTMPVALGEMLRLKNPQTQKEIKCRVCRFATGYLDGVKQVGIEFVAASPRFWNIAFPPADWDPAWVPPIPHERPEPLLPPPDPAGEPSQQRTPNTTSNDLDERFGEAMRGRHESSGNSKVEPRPRAWRILIWLTFITTGLIGLILLFAAMSHRSSTDTGPEVGPAIQDIAPEQARLIPEIENYRLATSRDFDPVAVSWLTNSGQQVSGEIQGAFSALGQSDAYVMVGKDGMWRIVILGDGKLRCDAQYRTVAIVARVAREAMHKIVWATPPPADSEGDGLLVVRSVNDLGSAVVLFLRGDEVVSGTPSGPWRIPLS
jgi:hypothetical protein